MHALFERILPLLGLAVGAAACGPSYHMTLPTAFKQYEDTREYKLITADGVRLEAREVDNYPKADLPFWTDALKRHMDARGYVFKSERCFETRRALGACTVDFVVPHGAEDWVLSETLLVDGDRIILIEAAGPFERFSKIEESLAKALETFEAES